MNSAKNNLESPIDSSPAVTVSWGQTALWLGVLLFASGCVHLVLFVILGTTWQGPLSLRKPALFGVSGGLTTWSIAWVMTQLRPKGQDRYIENAVAIGLFIEVALITLQYWRGVPSHFNRATQIDSAIEFAMLGLILFVSCAIVYLTFRTNRLRNIEPSMAIAIRGGMGLLALSCILGIATSMLGEFSISSGRSYETWGKAGVLKFPHGVALHAIQLLPAIAWFAKRAAMNHRIRIVLSALISQVVFLLYSIWQTCQGHDRFDWDGIGGGILGVGVLFGLVSAFELLRGCVLYFNKVAD